MQQAALVNGIDSVDQVRCELYHHFAIQVDGSLLLGEGEENLEEGQLIEWNDNLNRRGGVANNLCNFIKSPQIIPMQR